MIDVPEVTNLHRHMVVRWHNQPVDNPYEDHPWLGLVCQQFAFNFLLWHEEDIARSPDVGDTKVAEVKRAIDGYNQQRNDWIERLDDYLGEELTRKGVEVQDDVPLNTETMGSVIDRLSILALRIYHMEEELDRDDASEDHKASVERKLAVCFVQLEDLSKSLSELSAAVFQGQKRHKTYRQLKMYNDPALNPYLYKARHRRAG